MRAFANALLYPEERCRTALPENPYRIAVDIGVGRHECESMVDGVGHENAVEGIPVDPGKVSKNGHGGIIEIVSDGAERGFGFQQEFRRWRLEGEFAEAVLDLDFQHGDLMKDQVIHWVLKGALRCRA